MRELVGGVVAFRTDQVLIDSKRCQGVKTKEESGRDSTKNIAKINKTFLLETHNTEFPKCFSAFPLR